MAERESSKDLLKRCRSGDQAAAEELHRRYAQRLCDLAERQIDLRLRQRISPEDIVQSAFRTFFRRAERGEFQIDHSGALWRLLVRITLNKIHRQRERHRAGKRDVNAEVPPDGGQLLAKQAARNPTSEDAVCLLDELDFLFGGMKPLEVEIAQLCFQGHSTSEIAQRVNRSRTTVRRVLNRVGHRLSDRLKEDAGN